MSKLIFFPLFVCTLVGACALDGRVAGAQGVASQPPGKQVATTDVAAVATPSAPAASAPTGQAAEDQEDVEPEPVTGTEEAPSPATVAAPPPLPPCPTDTSRLPGRVASHLCERVRTEPPPKQLTVQNRTLRTLDYLIPFYVHRQYQAGWLSTDGKPLPVTEDLLKALGEAEQNGLRSADYPIAPLRKLLATLQQGNVSDPAQLADFDLLMSDTYLTYATHLLAGRLPPRKADPEWAIKPRARDLAEVLHEALTSGKIAESLHGLAPQGRGYVQLRDTLHRYRKVQQAGGWPTVSAGARLNPGAQGPQVQALRTRLQASGDLPETDASGNAVYDKALADAVRRFQKRHGLAETGAVNAATVAALNVPLAERIRQIELNLERWRWLPDEFGARYILVNIPSFRMNVIENGKRVIDARVVVGRQERQTPTFTANMAYLVLSPKWYVPRSIAVKDKLPQLKRNPYALARQNIRIYSSSGQQINPGAVNWKAVGANNFHYQFRQDAGPRNALGGIKFMFPNRYNIYLHDTPTRNLFSQNQRTFSSGCIRISNPVELAEYLLKHDPKWNRNTIKAAAASGKQRVVNLPQEVPVYLLYWTVWVDEDGLTNFRNDIYGRDKPMQRALYQGAGGSGSKGA